MKRYQLFLFTIFFVFLIVIAGCKKQDKVKLDELRQAVERGGREDITPVCRIIDAESSLIQLCAFGVNCTDGSIDEDLGVCIRTPEIYCNCPTEYPVCRLGFNRSVFVKDTETGGDTTDILENHYVGRCTNEGPLPRTPYNITADVLRIISPNSEDVKEVILRWEHSERSFERDRTGFLVLASFNDSSFQGIAAVKGLKSFNKTLDKSTKYGFNVIAESQYGKSELSNTVYILPDEQSNK